MPECDAGGCRARANREIWMENGHSLYACSHHCATWFPWVGPAIRFAPEDITIMGANDGATLPETV